MVRIPLRSTPLSRILANQNRKRSFFTLDVTVRLLSISQPYYRYLRAMNCLNSEDYNETFMEPVIVPQNVSGGLGLSGPPLSSRLPCVWSTGRRCRIQSELPEGLC